MSLGGPAPLLARRQVVTMHDATPFRLAHTYSRAFGTWYRFMYRVLARRALRIITVSQFSRDDLSDVLGVDRDRFVVAPNGLGHLTAEVEPVCPSGVPEGAYALMVGPAAARKNIAPVAASLAERGVTVVVVGGTGRGQVFASSGAPGEGAGRTASDSPGSVHRLGRLSDGEVAWVYQHAGVLVFPSLYEGFGLPVVEAQRFGCPVVASDRASLPEVAGDGAVLVDPVHIDVLVDEVREVLGDPAHADRLRERGRRNAERFTWEASAARVAAVVDRLSGTLRDHDDLRAEGGTTPGDLVQRPLGDASGS